MAAVNSNRTHRCRPKCTLVEDKPRGMPANWYGNSNRVTGFRGQHEEGGSMRGAANDLRNQAAAMGGNVLYGVSSPSQGMLSSLSRRPAR